MRMKMRDVAERAGVSPATVSRVLNGSETVGEGYREKVFGAIEELGYRPNRLASNLRKQKAEMIGVVVSDIENPHFTQMVRAVEDAAYGGGYRVLLCNTDETPEKQRLYLEMLEAERVLGVIISPSDPSAPEVSDLLDLDIPVVAFDRAMEDGRADAVVADNVGGVRLATEHLAGLGHKRIGFVGGPEKVETGAERLEGYRQAMLASGLDPVWRDGKFRMEDARNATLQLLDADGITALVVANNLMAIGALRALKDRDLKIPRDIALVSVDDPFWAELVDPPLTTLAQPVREMAEAAAGLLFERIDGKRTTPRKLTFPFELRVRGSCGALR